MLTIIKCQAHLTHLTHLISVFRCFEKENKQFLPLFLRKLSIVFINNNNREKKTILY